MVKKNPNIEEDEAEDEADVQYFCGAGPPPRGKVRAPLEYCLKNNQIRYYGIVAIDPALLIKTPKGMDLNRQKIKLRDIQADAKMLINQAKKLKIIIDDPRSTQSELKRARKKMDGFMKQRDELIKKLKKQEKVIQDLEESEERKKREIQKIQEKEKAKKKSRSKSRKK